MAEEQVVGKISHYYGNLGVAVVELSDNLSVGDKIHVKGATTDFEQTVDSMQIDKEEITSAKPNDVIGLKIADKSREGDIVYKAS